MTTIADDELGPPPSLHIPLPVTIPTSIATQEAFAYAQLVTNKMISTDYWDYVGVVLGFVGNLKTGNKRLYISDNEYTSRIISMHRTSDNSAIICESTYTIYIVHRDIPVVKRTPGSNW